MIIKYIIFTIINIIWHCIYLTYMEISEKKPNQPRDVPLVRPRLSRASPRRGRSRGGGDPGRSSWASSKKAFAVYEIYIHIYIYMWSAPPPRPTNLIFNGRYIYIFYDLQIILEIMDNNDMYISIYIYV